MDIERLARTIRLAEIRKDIAALAILHRRHLALVASIILNQEVH